jgi:hypothetical protein
MAIDDSARQRLDKRMEERRVELGLRWRQIADEIGLSVETLRATRKGKADISPFTRRAIERGLKWPPDEVDRIIEGDEWPAPTDDEIAAMNYVELGTYAARLEVTEGKDVADRWAAHAIEVRLARVKTADPSG